MLASLVGVPLYVDSPTGKWERMVFARACVEVSIGMNSLVRSGRGTGKKKSKRILSWDISDGKSFRNNRLQLTASQPW